MFHQYTSVCKHKLSWGSWVSLLDWSILCLYLLSEAPPTCCYHGDSPSWVSCLQGSGLFFVMNSVRNGEGGKSGNTCVDTQSEMFSSTYIAQGTRVSCANLCVIIIIATIL